jgi:hypothetical protein
VAFDQQAGLDDAADAAFERVLLDSAKADGVSDAATHEAWARFARATGAVALVAGSSAALHARHGFFPRLTHGTALRWLIVGAIGGSAVTALWMRGTHTSSVEQAPHSSFAGARSSTDDVAQHAAVGVPLRKPEPVSPVSAVSAGSSGVHAREAAGAGPRHVPAGAKRAPFATAGQSTSPPSSTLAAEVRAIDAVRTAIAVGAFRDATRLVGEYHREFPRGQLAADADVLAIESLEAAGEHDAAARRATEFLRQHPKDPHTGRIGALAGDGASLSRKRRPE